MFALHVDIVSKVVLAPDAVQRCEEQNSRVDRVGFYTIEMCVFL